jgi:dephospho-CoA kinase
MKIIGITGGMGSGKSTVCKIFEVLGIPVFYADAEAKKLMNEDAELKQQIINLLGNEAYQNGLLNRAFVAQKVFGNNVLLKQLNQLVHPASIQKSLTWATAQKSPYVVKEAALMFETDSFHHVNAVVGVYAPETVRMHRITQRDGLSYAQIKQRMLQQINEEIKMKLCDHVINNNGQESLILQVTKLHQMFTNS